jgi:hypothetical protein
MIPKKYQEHASEIEEIRTRARSCLDTLRGKGLSVVAEDNAIHLFTGVTTSIVWNEETKSVNGPDLDVNTLVTEVLPEGLVSGLLNTLTKGKDHLQPWLNRYLDISLRQWLWGGMNDRKVKTGGCKGIRV